MSESSSLATGRDCLASVVRVSGAGLTATITCPFCGHSKTETMRTDTCQHYYRCDACHAVVSPKAGDCCVYCSYADSACPPKQEAAKTVVRSG